MVFAPLFVLLLEATEGDAGHRWRGAPMVGRSNPRHLKALCALTRQWRHLVRRPRFQASSPCPPASARAA